MLGVKSADSGCTIPICDLEKTPVLFPAGFRNIACGHGPCREWVPSILGRACLNPESDFAIGKGQ